MDDLHELAHSLDPVETVVPPRHRPGEGMEKTTSAMLVVCYQSVTRSRERLTGIGQYKRLHGKDRPSFLFGDAIKRRSRVKDRHSDRDGKKIERRLQPVLYVEDGRNMETGTLTRISSPCSPYSREAEERRSQRAIPDQLELHTLASQETPTRPIIETKKRTGSNYANLPGGLPTTSSMSKPILKNVTTVKEGDVYKCLGKKGNQGEYYAVVVLPLRDFGDLGLPGSIWNTNLVPETSGRGYCYHWDRETRKITVADGYEDGGEKAQQRDIAIKYFDQPQFRACQYGWVRKDEIYELDTMDKIPFMDVIEAYIRSSMSLSHGRSVFGQIGQPPGPTGDNLNA
ncbi:hypothetical protein S40288_06002 [Stachybotrys chartarum IBT 40288]|nr:hypothetical protein S40288_06002 [Stachybotrys chartarum IBT 40288]